MYIHEWPNERNDPNKPQSHKMGKITRSHEEKKMYAWNFDIMASISEFD